VDEPPDDLPHQLEYRLPGPRGPVVLTALPRRAVEFVSTSGKSTAPLVRPTIPARCRRLAAADRDALEADPHPAGALASVPEPAARHADGPAAAAGEEGPGAQRRDP